MVIPECSIEVSIREKFFFDFIHLSRGKKCVFVSTVRKHFKQISSARNVIVDEGKSSTERGHVMAQDNKEFKWAVRDIALHASKLDNPYGESHSFSFGPNRGRFPQSTQSNANFQIG